MAQQQQQFHEQPCLCDRCTGRKSYTWTEWDGTEHSISAVPYTFEGDALIRAYVRGLKNRDA